MSLARRLKKLAMRASTTCPCRTRRLRFLGPDDDMPPAEDELVEGRCRRCGRIPPPSIIRFVHTERVHRSAWNEAGS